VMPTELKTDAGIVVSSVMTPGLMGWKVDDEGDFAGPPLVTLMMTRAATTTTTSPTAIHVKSPAGRPPFAGARLGALVGAGRRLAAEVLATVLLYLFDQQT
jgi:hypothetical protein